MPSRQTTIVLICALTLGASGCKKRIVHAAPPAAPPAQTGEPGTPSETAHPPARSAPAKPPSPSDLPKPEPPQISPGLSSEEQAEAERHTIQDLGAAERNLQAAYGKQLTASQHDLVEKIRGFMAQAREAIHASDWLRARNLAQKARVLSVELMNAL